MQIFTEVTKITFIPDNDMDVFDLGVLSTKLLRFDTDFVSSSGEKPTLKQLSMSVDELIHVLKK